MQPRAIPRHDVALAALVACAGLVTFAPALAGDFVHDDHRQIVGNPLVQDPRGWPALWTSGVWAGAGSLAAASTAHLRRAEGTRKAAARRPRAAKLAL